MEASTTIKQMLAGNEISVPNYQRAYSWAADDQVRTFLQDLKDYNKSSPESKYYFGHFLFEKQGDNKFGVIDGQQRMTTIVIFLSALFKILKGIRELTEKEDEAFEDIIKRKSTYTFDTVDYDNQFFRDYVIDDKKDKNGLETQSAERIVAAFDLFTSRLANKDEEYLGKMLETVKDARCTTHLVEDESEAVQMFIFQNNRGKKPSNLEIIKAQFMFNVHLYGGEEKEVLIEEIKNHFEKIYKNISSIDHKTNEDEVLNYTLRVHFNSLLELESENALNKIDKKLSEEDRIPFIKDFTLSLETNFKHLTTFFGKDERENLEIHSLITLGRIGIAMPFIIKAYKFGLSTDQINKLCNTLESILLRHRLIGTKANIARRLNDVYQGFTDKNSDQPIVERIDWMKGVDSYYWAHWNTKKLEAHIQGEMQHPTARYLLWKYENYLEGQVKSGYKPTRFEKIEKPELEHIAPKTENPEAGYDSYDQEFIEQYLDCLGNYLLVPESHNRSIGNKPFEQKRDSYTELAQQREIREMTKDDLKWTKEKIAERKKKIV